MTNPQSSTNPVTWYKVLDSDWQPKKLVEPVEVHSVTAKRLKVGDRVRNIRSSYENYFPTEREALVFLSARHGRWASRVEADLQRARSALGMVQSRLKETGE